MGWISGLSIAATISSRAALSEAVHGISRSGELRYALRTFRPLGVERNGVLTGYLTAPTLWIMNHGVPQSERFAGFDPWGRCHVLGASLISSADKTGILFPLVVGEGFGVVKPMTLMATGRYQEPRGCFFPSVLY